MIALYYVAVAIITAYLAYTIYAFNKIPKSISDTYYQWCERGAKFLFTFVMWATGFPILVYWVDAAPRIYQFLPFLSISGMVFVGGACAFKETLTETVHYVSAGIWAGAALLFFVLVGNWLAIGAGAAFAVATLALDKNRYKHQTFWLECACIVVMMVGIYML